MEWNEISTLENPAKDPSQAADKENLGGLDRNIIRYNNGKENDTRKKPPAQPYQPQLDGIKLGSQINMEWNGPEIDKLRPLNQHNQC